MNLQNLKFKSSVSVPPSKSEAQRYIICAALSQTPTDIYFDTQNICEDIKSSIRCIEELGAKVVYCDGFIHVIPATFPIDTNRIYSFNTGESATLKRILLPILTVFGLNYSLTDEGTLKKRPVDSILFSDLLKQKNSEICVDGSKSSQTVSGLIFAMCFTGGSLKVGGKAVSTPYIKMTVDILRLFGAKIEANGLCEFNILSVDRFVSPGKVFIGGDYSSAAYPLIGGLIGNHSVTVTGLKKNSLQGDSQIVEFIKQFNGKISENNNGYTALPSKLTSPGKLDMSSYPDLVLPLAVCALFANGTTVFTGVGHLRTKESDRISALCELFSILGGQISVCDSEGGCELSVSPTDGLHGGNIKTFADHRVALTAILLSTVSKEAVRIDNIDCISKSWPAFTDCLEPKILSE